MSNKPVPQPPIISMYASGVDAYMRECIAEVPMPCRLMCIRDFKQTVTAQMYLLDLTGDLSLSAENRELVLMALARGFFLGMGFERWLLEKEGRVVAPAGVSPADTHKVRGKKGKGKSK